MNLDARGRRLRAALAAMLVRDLGPFILVVMVAAGASGGEGWYLITPKLKMSVSDAAWERISEELDKGRRGSPDVFEAWWLDLKSPITEWNKRKAFDSQRDCETMRRSAIQTGINPLYDPERVTAITYLEGQRLSPFGLAFWRQARCVRADTVEK